MPDLAEELGHEERDDVEWIRDAEDSDLLRAAVCALAKDRSKRRKDRTPIGLTVDDALMLQVTNTRDRHAAALKERASCTPLGRSDRFSTTHGGKGALQAGAWRRSACGDRTNVTVNARMVGGTL